VDDPQTENEYDGFDYDNDIPGFRKSNREKSRAKRLTSKGNQRKPRRPERRERVEARDGTFRCKHCKTMVGVPLSGGKHRNHCPLCLYSRHVDRRMPGDRAANCRSMMEPVGITTRRDGEQMLVHECRGCGVIRHNRIAADDNVVATMRLPVLSYQNETTQVDQIGERTA
jgi:hypothetical protein